MKLNELGRKHGIGRVDMVENRFVGIKSRGVYETPGGTIIYVAHKDLEGITMERETMHIRDMMMPSYAGAIYNGFWYSPEREAMQAFIDKSQERVSGTVRLKLYKGQRMARRPRIQEHPVLRRPRHLRGMRHLRPQGRRRLHQAEQPPHPRLPQRPHQVR